MSDVSIQMSGAFDAILLDILKNGREVVDREGNVERVQATAADLNVVRQRLKDCGITAELTDTNPIGNIVEEMQRRGLKLPALDMEGDDAASA
jgi:hypothetical protein